MNAKLKCIYVVLHALTITLLMAAVNPPAQADEAQLIAVLEGDGDWNAKYTACTELRQVGTAASIPALAALLHDDRLSHMARYALQPMPYPEVNIALRDALRDATGAPKVGIIISLGVRRDVKAVRLLTKSLNDANPNIVRAAAGALGRTGSVRAANALTKAHARLPETLRPALNEGLLVAAERFTHQKMPKRAVAIYKRLLDDAYPVHIRMGAFRGLTRAQPSKAPDLVIDALAGPDPLFRDLAGQIVAETAGAASTIQYSEALPSLPVQGQVALLRGFAGRADDAARPVVAHALGSADKHVQHAALATMEVIGAPEDVKNIVLLLASKNSEIRSAAQATLATMPGKNINRALAAELPSVPGQTRATLLELLTGRNADDIKQLVIQNLDDKALVVRLACLRTLRFIGGANESALVTAIVCTTKDTKERAAAEKALYAICLKEGESTLDVILDAIANADAQSLPSLLRALGKIGGPTALQTVLAALDHKRDGLGDEALRVLSDWPTLDAAPHLQKLAQSNSLTQQVLGLRGYVRLATIEASHEEKVTMLKKATQLAKRPEELKLVLAAWGTIPTSQSLALLLNYLEDENVLNEAASAIVAVASQLGKESEEHKDEAIAALKKVLSVCENENIRNSASEALTNL